MTHTTTTIQAVGPSGPGALSGFESICSCGLQIRSSLLTIISADVADHLRWAARPVRKARKAR